MNVYILKSDAKYKTIVPIGSPEVLDELKRFNGKPIGKSWEPLRVEFDEELPTNGLASDFPHFLTHVPAFSKRAVKLLADLLEPRGEILPLICDSGQYFAYNVTTLVDAMDLELSSLVRFSSGRIMHVNKYVLCEERIQDPMIFKLPQVPLMSVFVTEPFLRLVKEANLSGFSFVPVTLKSAV